MNPKNMTMSLKLIGGPLCGLKVEVKAKEILKVHMSGVFIVPSEEFYVMYEKNNMYHNEPPPHLDDKIAVTKHMYKVDSIRGPIEDSRENNDFFFLIYEKTTITEALNILVYGK